MLRALFWTMLFIAVLFAAVVTYSIRRQLPGKRSVYVFVVVKQGDTIWTIARWSGVSPERLYEANQQISDPAVIPQGERIRIPASNEQLPGRSLPPPTPQPAPIAEAPAPPPSPPEPQLPQQPSPPPVGNTYSGPSLWDRLAQCESGGNWATNSGNGYFGGLQFALSSWRAVGGSGLPNEASRDEQIARAQALLARQGWRAWPVCSDRLGL